MKKILGLALLAATFTTHAAFVHPLDFDGSAAQQKTVIEYIQGKVKKEYCEGPVDMCQPTTLRMMEKQNLSAFKKLAKAENRPVLDKVIADYCHGPIDMCNYSTLNMMYQQNLKASGEKLTW